MSIVVGIEPAGGLLVLLPRQDGAAMNHFMGEIKLFAGTVPRGWVRCEGQMLSVERHAALHRIIGQRFGGDGKTTFALPDLRGRVACGPSAARPVGTAYGQETVKLAMAEMPAHAHQLYGTNTAASKRQPTGYVLATPAATSARPYATTGTEVTLADQSVGNAGDGAGHHNMQPFVVMTYAIAVTGMYFS